MQAISAAKVDRQGGGVVAIRIRSGHGVAAEIGVGGSRDGRGILFEHREVATVEVGEDFHLGRSYGGVGLELDGQRGSFSSHLVQIKAAEPVVAIGLVAADRNDHLRIAHVKTAVEILVPDRGSIDGLVFGNFQIVRAITVERGSLG